jgi:hypothetical protein
MQLTVLIAAICLQGCVHLPPEVREELRCGAPDNFGNPPCDGASR